MGRVLATAVAASVVAVTTFVSGCGSSGGAPTSPTPSPNADVFTVNVVREAGPQSFSPNPASPGGRSVVFRNTDSVIHRVRLNDGSIDTGDILPGQSSNPVQMPAGGTNYHCSLHPTMVGAVSAASGQPPPPCEGIYCD